MVLGQQIPSHRVCEHTQNMQNVGYVKYTYVYYM